MNQKKYYLNLPQPTRIQMYSTVKGADRCYIGPRRPAGWVYAIFIALGLGAFWLLIALWMSGEL